MPDVISLVGCGGKTSLMWSLAGKARGQHHVCGQDLPLRCLKENPPPQKKILVTTTTHTQRPSTVARLFDRFIDELEAQCIADGSACAGGGITFAGCIDQGSGSLHSFSLPLLESIIPHFDYVLIEGDGSRSMPLKGWADYEPVITKSTTVTIGILPVWTVGMPVSDTIIHRLPLWLSLTGARENGIISAQHLANTIYATSETASSTKSLFSSAAGKKILFFSQVKNEHDAEIAQAIFNLLPKDFCASLDSVIAGNVQAGTLLLSPAYILQGLGMF
ncbi:MAG: selenium cofactor biosynthesis protein YqeC [Termitinemataceae bacterium]|nr:MAG: selenium cofactor biosynthesis protein YqeC [Termitinemataceae bacterium]